MTTSFPTRRPSDRVDAPPDAVEFVQRDAAVAFGKARYPRDGDPAVDGIFQLAGDAVEMVGVVDPEIFAAAVENAQPARQIMPDFLVYSQAEAHVLTGLHAGPVGGDIADEAVQRDGRARARSEEHTSELQSLMRISYAVFCLKK